MEILPIRILDDTDATGFGTNLVNLAKLQRIGFSVASGIAVSPPDFLNQAFTELKSIEDKSSLELEFGKFKRNLLKQEMPSDLNKEISKFRAFFVKSVFINSKKDLWTKLLQVWLGQLQHTLWNNQGIAGDIVFSALEVFFCSKPYFQVSAYFDSRLNEVVVTGFDKVSPQLLQKIDMVVRNANKKLVFPQIYQFVSVREGLFLIAVRPDSGEHKLLKSEESENIVINQERLAKYIRPAVKIYLCRENSFNPYWQLDGVFFSSEKELDLNQALLNIIQIQSYYPEKSVIYKLPDIIDMDLRGAIRLIAQKGILQRHVEAVIFLRNKKNFTNLDVAIPYVRSVQELIAVKRELAAYGINRKGSLKLWMEAAVPENIVNIDSYVEAGIDGIVLNLDELQQYLCGYRYHEAHLYKDSWEGLVKFLQPFFKTCHKYKIPIMAKGTLVQNHDILQSLLNFGVWAVALDSPIVTQSMPERLRWEEERIVQERAENNLRDQG